MFLLRKKTEAQLYRIRSYSIRATVLRRLLFSQDDLLTEAARRQRRGIAFAGVVYAHQLYITVGRCISDLETIAKVGNAEDLADQVQFLRL